MVLYNLARISALSGNKKQAWKWLDLAVEAGFKYTHVFKYYPALKMLRQDPKWEKSIFRIPEMNYMSLDLNLQEGLADQTKN